MKRTVVTVTRRVTSDADKRDEMEKWRRAEVCARGSANMLKEKHQFPITKISRSNVKKDHIGFSVLK